MQNTADTTTDLDAVLVEAASRLRFVVHALESLQENDIGANGYDFAICREVLDDVADTLLAASRNGNDSGDEKGGA